MNRSLKSSLGLKSVASGIVCVVLLPGCANHWHQVAEGKRCPLGFSDAAPSDADAAAFAPPTASESANEDPLTRMVFDFAREGNVEAIGEYLAAGRTPNLVNAKGDRLLCVAAYHRQEAVVNALLAIPGVEVDAASRNGFTPLIGAAFHGDLAIARALLHNGAAIDGHDALGRTPLMFAAMFGRGAMVDFLLERGAQREARDAEGRTAADLARAQGAHEIAARLEGSLTLP